MVVGILIGKILPVIPNFLGKFEYASVSIPVAVLIWLMIYPMMLKVDFQSTKDVGKNPKGLVGYCKMIGRDQFGNWRNTVLMEHPSSNI